MRILIAFLICLSVTASGQQPSTINLYGLSFLTQKQRNSIGYLPSSFPGQNDELLKNRYGSIKGIRQISIHRVCCSNGSPVIFIGLSRKKQPKERSVSPHHSTGSLPETLLATYESYLRALAIAASNGRSEDDLSHGYSMMKDTSVSKFQHAFIALMKDSPIAIKNAALQAASPTIRAAAMTIVPYGSDKHQSAEILQLGIKDSDATVRNNAIRGLAAIAFYANRHPQEQIGINYRPLIKLLHSLHWSDRDKALFALMSLTENHPSKLLRALKGARKSLTEMAAWNSPAHAIMAYFILGRMDGWADDQIYESWKTKLAKNAAQ